MSPDLYISGSAVEWATAKSGANGLRRIILAFVAYLASWFSVPIIRGAQSARAMRLRPGLQRIALASVIGLLGCKAAIAELKMPLLDALHACREVVVTRNTSAFSEWSQYSKHRWISYDGSYIAGVGFVRGLAYCLITPRGLQTGSTRIPDSVKAWFNGGELRPASEIAKHITNEKAREQHDAILERGGLIGLDCTDSKYALGIEVLTSGSSTVEELPYRSMFCERG